MYKKIKEFFANPELEVKERLFRVILLVGILVASAAVIQGVVLSNFYVNTAISFLLLILMGSALWMTVKKQDIDFPIAMTGVILICVVLPIMFFGNGGVYGGAAIWFVLGILYIFMMFSGKKLAFFVVLAVITDFITYIVAYQNPEWIVFFSSKSEIYYDSLFSIFAVGLAVGGIMRYQIHILQHEREITLQQKEEIEQISKSKDLFFANMSHEIRTPISTIIGLNEMILREENLTKEIEEDAFYIQKASKTLLELINDILDLSQIESQRMEIVPMQYKTEELFRELVNIVHPQLKKKNLKFIVDIDEKLPGALYGDETRIRQIVLNILTNAVKYTEKGSVTLSVHGEMMENGNIQMKISVADTGIGIKKEDLDHLYDSFRRVDQAKNRKIEGSGLGLSIARQLAELMGGKITVDSVYMNGSIFTVMLPQQIAEQEPMGKVDYLDSGVGSREHYQKRFEASEARILLVDDDENNLMVAKKLLRETKVQIDVAKGGKECLEKTKMKYYHLILLDHMMPEMDGIETLTEIRRQENGMCRESAIVALTANISAADERSYLDMGFDGYIGKPIDGIKLEEEVLRHIPTDLIEYRQQSGENRTRSTLGFENINAKRHRKKIIVTTDCICDLPENYLKEYDIRLMYLYVETANGCFRDTEEIETDNLSRYLTGKSSTANTISPTVEEYEAFYAEVLLDAEEVLHISLAKNIGKCYGNAMTAAKGFDHVHVMDSGHMSCGEGLMVLYAANLAKQGCTIEEIQEKVDAVRGKIHTSFLLPSANVFFEKGFMNRSAYHFCEKFNLHPMIEVRKSKMVLSGIRTNRLDLARKHYIRQQLFWKSKIDQDVICITFAGCSVEEQREILQNVEKYGSFRKVIMQKASVSSACNAGFGAIGIAYMTKTKVKDFLM